MTPRSSAESLIRKISPVLFITLGIFLAAFGLKGFILPNNFIDGGVTGISIMLSLVLPIPFAVFLFLVNIPFVLLAWKYVSKRMAINTTLAVLGLSLVVGFVEFPIVTQDKLLSAVFGGIFLGSGIGVAIRGNSALDGTEILALVLSRKTAFTVGNIITIFNVVIFTCAIYLIGVEASLYSILTYMSAAKSIDFLLYGVEEFYGITIVSDYNEAIKKRIFEEMQRGVTVYEGHGGYTSKKAKILFCVFTKLETARVKRILEDTDPHAFVVYHVIRDAHGGLTQKKYMKM